MANFEPTQEAITTMFYLVTAKGQYLVVEDPKDMEIVDWSTDDEYLEQQKESLC